MPIKYIIGAISTLGLLSVASAAQAGNCGGPNCNVPVQYVPTSAPNFGPMSVTSVNPMGHLRSVNFQRAPHVSIMRVHSMMPTANLSDAPSGFSGGCHPQSTQYCRQDAGIPVNVELFAPQAPAQPIGPRFGSGYDASKFAPRQYGDNTFTPGIAHIPTSIVDRDPVRADMALNSGRAVPQPIANGGVAPRPSMVSQSYGSSYSMAPRPMMASPMPAPISASIPVRPIMMAPTPSPYGLAGAPVLQSNGTYGSSVGADGTYWEKTSGPTMFGNTMATQVICKRKMPSRVVNPVVGVPVGVPTPVHTGCAPQVNGHHGHAQHQSNGHPGWTY